MPSDCASPLQRNCVFCSFQSFLTCFFVKMRGQQNTKKHDTFEMCRSRGGNPRFFALSHGKKHSPSPDAAGWLVGGGWLVGWLAGLAGLAGWLAGLAGLVGWLAGLAGLVGWLGWLAGWLVGWLAGKG